jgi:trans-aconitate 2-methyltransferase
MSPRDWDAQSYEAQAGGVRAFGHILLEALELRGDEVVLDAGCGDGGVTRDLLDRLPDGRVYAVDGSPAMAQRARVALGGDPRASVLVSDLLELELPEPVDVAFSSATFHWISDHDRLFERLRSALRPGGRLLAQCGGAGNIAAVREAIAEAASQDPYRRRLHGWEGPWNFATPEETLARLERAGFADAQAGLHTEIVHSTEPVRYLATIILGEHLERLPAWERDGFAAAVAARLPDPLDIEYVRLTLRARRA